MRNVARLKMGYYPLPEAEGVKLRSLLSFPDPASVIDPCVGQGTALHLVTSDAEVRRYGVELDAERARIAGANGIATIQGNAFDAIARPESFSLLYPPDRIERAFKEAEEDRTLANRHRNQRAAQSLRLSEHAFNLRGDVMSEERDKVRCRSCELVQWSDRANCRRCGEALPEPIVRIVERVVEKIVIRQDPQCLQKLEQASRLISTATERLTQQSVESVAPIVLAQVPETGAFPTMAEVERAMIVAAYERSNRRPLEAARLLGIGKTTVYRKLRAMGEAAA